MECGLSGLLLIVQVGYRLPSAVGVMKGEMITSEELEGVVGWQFQLVLPCSDRTVVLCTTVVCGITVTLNPRVSQNAILDPCVSLPKHRHPVPTPKSASLGPSLSPVQ